MGYSDKFISSRLTEMKGKKAIVRVDISVPLTDGKINKHNIRLKACSKALQKYLAAGIIPIVLSHQGRKGDEDYLESLEQHAELLADRLKGYNVIYSNSLGGKRTERAVAKLKEGDILILKNTRSHPDEKKEFKNVDEVKNCKLVRELSNLADIFINDAPATMHRADASLIGFRYVMPAYLGVQMEDELKILNEIKSHLKAGKKTAIIFGGKKWEKFDYVYEIAKNKNVIVLCGGVPGQSVCYTQNSSSFNKENEEFLLKTGNLDTAAKLLGEFGNRIVFPMGFILDNHEDVSIEDLKSKHGMIMDIGEKALNKFFNVIESSEMVIYAGPVGRYEKGYNQTIRLITRFMGGKTMDYTFGGNSADSMDDIGLDKAYAALGGKIMTTGGAGLAYIAEKELPVLEAFEGAEVRQVKQQS